MQVGRGEHWHGVAPEGGEPFVVRLPPEGTLSQDESYVPAGWFRCGGDLAAAHSLREPRLWVDALVMRRFPITNRQYMGSLDDLIDRGREDEALRYVPWRRPHGSAIWARFCTVERTRSQTAQATSSWSRTQRVIAGRLTGRSRW